MKYFEFDEIYWAPTPKMFGGWICHKDSPKAPPPPDYAGAANATAAGNQAAARSAAAANRVNQVTPYGNLTYTHSGEGDDGWTATQTLSPGQQALLDSNNKLSLGLSETAGRGLTYANDVLSKPGVDTSTLPQVGIDPGQSYQDAMMSRLRPQIDRENNQSDAQLANQGIMQGSEAYKNAKTLLGQQHNDLLNNSTVQGFNTGLAANQNAFQQKSYNQMQPINVINALRSGTQVSNPNFVNVPQQATTAGADLSGAASQQNQYGMGLYNSQVGSNNATMGALGSLAGAGIGLFSDVRLKTNIKRIGTHNSGIGIYSYIKFGKPEIGVLAQELETVMPHAVATHSSGFKMIDVGAL